MVVAAGNQGVVGFSVQGGMFGQVTSSATVTLAWVRLARVQRDSSLSEA